MYARIYIVTIINASKLYCSFAAVCNISRYTAHAEAGSPTQTHYIGGPTEIAQVLLLLFGVNS